MYFHICIYLTTFSEGKKDQQVWQTQKNNNSMRHLPQSPPTLWHPLSLPPSLPPSLPLSLSLCLDAWPICVHMSSKNVHTCTHTLSAHTKRQECWPRPYSLETSSLSTSPQIHLPLRSFSRFFLSSSAASGVQSLVCLRSAQLYLLYYTASSLLYCIAEAAQISMQASRRVLFLPFSKNLLRSNCSEN